MARDSGPALEAPESAPPAIVVDDVHIRYRVLEDRNLRLAELVRSGFRSRRGTEVHAVRGVSLTIGVGQAVGLIGPNGSGKSTLLRAIAGVQPMSAGRVLIRGRAQLLAVNAALDAQLSGRRNVMLGGLAMGLLPDEIEARMPDVIEFSELADAIDRPMRTYSSGMKARLTFSIATMTQPPILLIDEALAVGDRHFRRKSLERLREMQQQAGTLVMVTHNLNEIRQTCSRAIWLESGQIVMDGPADDVANAYEADD
ncbi:MAG: ABC transporter ATP-binding protein [Ilumatobacteraceae bacterium]|nr:ABC transporter ATP-binding protein [Ilumatobacteraceae bacterium]